MRRLIAITAGIACAFSASSALACSMPQPTALDRMELMRVLDSEAFDTEVAALVEQDPFVRVQSIDLTQGYKFQMSNGCVISAQLQYTQPDVPGMCPMFSGVAAETECN